MKTLTTLLSGAALAASTAPALLQEAADAMPDMDHSGTGMPARTVTQAYMEAVDVMMSGMSAKTYSGDADADLLLMIPHYQSAMDVSRALLEETDTAKWDR